MKKYLKYVPHGLITLGIFFLGVFFGLIYQINSDEIKICTLTVPEKEKVCVLDLSEISPFGIKGRINGNDLRLSNGENILEVKKEEEFQFNTAKIFRNIKAVIPENTRFFASNRGKTFYSINNTKQLEKTRPENLVFFKDEKEAIGSGYKGKSL